MTSWVSGPPRAASPRWSSNDADWLRCSRRARSVHGLAGLAWSLAASMLVLWLVVGEMLPAAHRLAAALQVHP